MYPVTKWMVLVVLIGANGDAIARAEAYDLDSVAGDTSCRARLVCAPEVRPNVERLLINSTRMPSVGGSHGRDGNFPLVDDVDGAPRYVGHNRDVNSVTHGRFACGEVVSGYTVTCTTAPPRRTVSAPEIDTGVAVSGTIFLMGFLAILRGRQRRLVDSPVGR